MHHNIAVCLLASQSINQSASQPEQPRRLSYFVKAYTYYIKVVVAQHLRFTQKYQDSSTPKNIWNFSNPKRYPPFKTLTEWKDPKCIEMTLKYSPIMWQTPKISTKSSYPKNIHFSENPKTYWNWNFWTPKMALAYVCMKILEYPPPPLLSCVSCSSG